VAGVRQRGYRGESHYLDNWTCATGHYRGVRMGLLVTNEDMEEFARKMAASVHGEAPRERDLVRMILAYGNHRDECAQLHPDYGHENDCTCGWSPIRYYLNVYERARKGS